MAFSLISCVIFLVLSIFTTPLWTSVSCAAFPTPSQRTRPTILPRDLPPCGAIFQAAKTGQNAFFASDVYSCLTSSPFRADVAKSFLQYYRDTLQFQSTLAYLKNPPASYKQPSVDLLAGLDLIDNEIDLGVYDNEYAFEAAVQTLIYAAHDLHLQFVGGVLSPFSFASPLGIVSLSSDGVELPKVYILDDIAQADFPWTPGAIINSGPDQWSPSAVASIDATGTTQFLSRHASLNAFGNRDPQADWNQLMYNPAGDIQNVRTAFQGASPFYYGDVIDFEFENGTSTGALSQVAVFTNPLNPQDIPDINDGVDLYNYYVLAQSPPPQQSDSAATTTAAIFTAAAPTTTFIAPLASETSSTIAVPDFATGPAALSWSNPAYPYANISQTLLGTFDGGVVTGYFLDSSVGVLSIPSFNMIGDTLMQFSNTVGEFLSLSKQAGMTKILVDVQQNYGGDPLLSVDTFKHFFPTKDPFGGSRSRAQNMANTLGTVFTSYFESLNSSNSDYPYLAASVWVATDYINAATGQNFSSWPQYFGPHPDHGDLFTTTQRENLSSVAFDEAATGGLVVYGYGNRSLPAANSTNLTQTYAAEDIVILTDSICHSACSLFVEMMHHEAGVRTVVAGGLPSNGPMQALGGTRGALQYSAGDIDDDIATFQDSPSYLPLPNRTTAFWIQFAGINLRDQIRKGQNFPLQFAYEAADCRIFYTPENFVNFTALWQHAADAVFTNPALCVQGSTGQIATNQSTNMTIINADSYNSTYKAIHLDSPAPSYSPNILDLASTGPQEDGRFSGSTTLNNPCTPGSCAEGQTCTLTELCSGTSSGGTVTVYRCKLDCVANSFCRSPLGDTRTYLCDTSERSTGGFGTSVCEPSTPPVCAPLRRSANAFPDSNEFRVGSAGGLSSSGAGLQEEEPGEGEEEVEAPVEEPVRAPVGRKVLDLWQ